MGIRQADLLSKTIFEPQTEIESVTIWCPLCGCEHQAAEPQMESFHLCVGNCYRFQSVS